jgi:DNA-binding Lrp family transcriptional regulator
MSAQRKRVTDQDILEEFRQSPDAFLTAAEIAESIPMTRQGVNNRLKRLEEEGLVKRKKAGSRAVGWWLAN